MNGVMKGMILVLMILYIVSPIDACPGPIDDIMALLLGLAATKGQRNHGRVRRYSDDEDWSLKKR